MFCARCGKQIEDDSTFCAFCGQQVGEPVEDSKRAGNSMFFHIPAKKTIFVAVICIVLLVFISKFFKLGSSGYDKTLKAYLKYADSIDYEASYYLTDMDNDSVPECLVWDYAGNGNLNHVRVLGYKKQKLVEVSSDLGSGTVSSNDNIQDGTIIWNLENGYFILYRNRQQWWGDLLKREDCFEFIYKISSSGFEECHFIRKSKDNNVTYWSCSVDDITNSSEAENRIQSIYSEVYDGYIQSKEPMRYVSIEEAIENYEEEI